MNTRSNPGQDKIMEERIAGIRREQQRMEKGYREQAMRLFPPVCAKCGREFSGKRIRELTVHHKDHNHHNNPPDGSNWELLCLYCHDNEHSRLLDAEWYGAGPEKRESRPAAMQSPFANLGSLLKSRKEP